MNYIQMFANGGKTSDQDIIIGALNQIGVIDENEIAQYLQVAMNKYGSFAGIGQALKEALQGVSSDEELQSAIASVFDVDLSSQQESQMFKCGGKLQQLVSKFGKGGNVDCGCGGIKVGQDGFKTSGSGTDPDSGFHTWDIEVTPQKDTIIRYSYPSYNGKAVLTPNGGTVKEWLNGDMFPTIYRDRNWVNRHPRRFLLPFSGGISNRKIMNARELAQNHIPSQQEGGVMLEQMHGHDINTNLTRRQARDLSALNQGYNGEQFQTAMANAINALRNQGLRGKELRERAREMAAGIIPVERSINVPTASTFGNITPIKEGDLRSQTPTQVSVQEPISQPVTPTQEQSLDNLSFAQAFAQSRKSGAKTFNWRGTSYGTNLDEPSNNQTYPEIGELTKTLNYNVTPNAPQQSSKTNDIIADKSKRGFWNRFVNATLNAQSAELPVSTAVMAASGLHKDRNGNWYQEQTDEDKQLGKNLALLGAAGALGGSTLFGSTTYYPIQQALTAAPKPFLLPPVSPVPFKQGGQIEKGQGGFPNGILTDKITTVKGPSIGQRRLGVIRPWITQHIVYNQQANPDTLYFGKNVNAFDSSLPVNITERETMVLPQSVKNKLANIVDSDYNEYNTSRGSYPNGYYEKTIDTKYKKK